MRSIIILLAGVPCTRIVLYGLVKYEVVLHKLKHHMQGRPVGHVYVWYHELLAEDAKEGGHVALLPAVL